jgi:uncharacterized protein (TIGR02757 family)
MTMNVDNMRRGLDAVYRRYARPEFIRPDPLEFVLRYDRREDREVAGLIAACLAFGRVRHILRSVEAVLAPAGGAPAAFIDAGDDAMLRRTYASFRHRWIAGGDVADLLMGMRALRSRHGSLEASFAAFDDGSSETVLPALVRWTAALRDAMGRDDCRLLPDPAKSGACKRLHLYLRWMARDADVDPGVWRGISPARLIVPLDVHMHRIARSLGFTRRRQASRLAALDVTRAFRRICPEDPIRYDFPLTRFGIREGAGPREIRGLLTSNDWNFRPRKFQSLETQRAGG